MTSNHGLTEPRHALGPQHPKHGAGVRLAEAFRDTGWVVNGKRICDVQPLDEADGADSQIERKVRHTRARWPRATRNPQGGGK